MNLLINLPSGFFSHANLAPRFAKLKERFDVRERSHNTAEEIAEDLKWADAVIMWSWPVLDDELLDASGEFKYIGQIDVSQKGATCTLKRNIPLSCSRSGFSPAVAEMALGLILNGLRRISDYHGAMRSSSESWVEAFPDDIDVRERQLSGASVGIIGFGKVGQRLGELLAPFGVSLNVYDPYVPEAVVSKFEAQSVSLDELVEGSEVVVLCAASNDGTDKLINADRIGKLQKDSLFVNVARASLVDYAALAERLEKGDMQAALDVFEVEPLEADSKLRSLPNAYLTPHRAGGVIASVERNIDWLIEDMDRVLAGESQKYPIVEAMIPSLDA
ncbi:NAD(P)-dependent oxidoreductase [Pelagicoccus mobilis]|uniref:D-isomer specific 2-hydroxyacid dehydrogenase NAD-binding domain-containing protein n=1 Tax=Pelagicoccus mobilis TaxID=415221 RepID=A0A934S157_9BACT|nr:NAD(P)-dependent oxidoreductase [Pelagicoccus mobilis]MBK1880451.1 hypothetical protein [Pelagicoccus mobilis]